MAQSNLKVVLELDGVKIATSDIEKLSAAIESAKTKLGQLGNTPEGQKLAGQINTATVAVTNLKSKTDSINVSKKISEYAKFGSAVTSGFAAATAAVSLFGGETDRVSRAATQAQQLLTIAISARGVAEGITALKTISLDVATKASTLSTNAANTATKALWATLAANPLTAVLAVVGLLVAAFIALADSEDEAEQSAKDFAESQKQLNAELDKTDQIAGTNADSIGRLINRYKDGEISANQLQSAINALAPALRNVDFTTKEGQATLNRYAAAQNEVAQATREINLLQSDFDKNQKNYSDARKREVRNRIADLQLQRTNELRIINEIETAEKEREENRKKRIEAERQRLLDLIKLRGDLRKIELEAITSGPAISSFTLPETNLEKQEKNLKRLAAVQTDYNDAIEKYNELSKLPETTGEGLGSIGIPPNVTKQFSLLQQLVEKTFELVKLPYKETSENLVRLLTTQNNFLQGTESNVDKYITNQQELLKFERDFINKFVTEQIKGFSGNAEQVKLQRQILAEQGKIVFDNLIQNARELNKVTTILKGYNDKISDLAKSNANLAQSTEVLNGFIRENTKLLVDSFELPIKSIEETKAKIAELQTEITTQRFDNTKKFADDIVELERILAEKGIDISKASYEEKLRLLNEFLIKELTEEEKAALKAAQIRKKRVDDFKKGLQEVQAVLTSISQFTTDFYNRQFDELEARNKKTQDSIIGDTEAANEKRIEAEKTYQEQRKEIEKRAAKASLQIALSQAIANAAGAIVRVSEQTGVLAPIAAAVIAGINVVQVAQIASQLSAIDSYAKGGFIKGQGGLVVGPSHEFGGVKYAQGGVELEGGEAVINRVSSVRYQGLLSEINQAGGGRPLVMNNFDDTRIVEAIAKQKKEPLRAYVLEGDITEKQQVNKRLEQLAQI